MIKGDDWYMIRQQRREGLSISEIARRTGYDRKTVRKIINGDHQPIYKPRPQRPSKLDPYKDYLAQRIEKGVINGVKLLREIRAKGYTGGATILRDFIQPHRSKVKAIIRYETPPGYQAQVDWGHAGKIIHKGVLKTVYLFCLTLGYSRMMYIEFTLRCDTRAFIRCHINAFNFFGGITKTCLYDNLKSVRLITGKDGVKINPTFADFADTFGFEPRLCRPRRPQTKGKVESGIAYIKGNFLLGETFIDLDEINIRGLGWLNDVANIRIHGTTGEIPKIRFLKEGLSSIRSNMIFDTALYEKRKITPDCLVSYKSCRYGVPHKFAGRECKVRDHENGSIDVLVDGDVVATHSLSPNKGRTIIVSRYYAGIKIADMSIKPRLALLCPINPPDVETRGLDVYQALVGDRP